MYGTHDVCKKVSRPNYSTILNCSKSIDIISLDSNQIILFHSLMNGIYHKL